MSQTHVTADQDAVITVIEIAAPPARVFEALTTRSQMMLWGSDAKYKIVEWEMDARLGGKWSFLVAIAAKPEHKGHYHHGEILAIDPPRLLEYSWYASFHPDQNHQTVVRWELSAIAQGTHLKVTHSGLKTMDGMATGYSQGWPGLVESLRNYLEKLAA